MTHDELMMLRGAAYMREKIAQCIEASPRKPIYECGPHIRTAIKLPTDKEIEIASEKWIDCLLEDN